MYFSLQHSGKFSRGFIFAVLADQGETTEFYTSECFHRPAIACDPRKLNREKLQNHTSAKIATLENFPLYGILPSKIY